MKDGRDCSAKVPKNPFIDSHCSDVLDLFWHLCVQSLIIIAQPTFFKNLIHLLIYSVALFHLLAY